MVAPILQIIGFLLVLKAFWSLRVVNESGKKTISGEIEPKPLKLGLVLVTIGLGLRYIPNFEV